ncbi:hypothetical protein MCERH3_00288 [Candidatus Nanopelagicaceae bacterium]
MKKILAFLTAAVLISGSLANPAMAAVKAGAACTKAGSTSTISSKKYTCVKSGKKLIWDKGSLIKRTSTQPPIVETANSKPASGTILLPGASCTAADSTGIKIADGVLYCVPVSDGSNRYIEHFDVAPVINNPQTPEMLESCQSPDLRGKIPEGMSILATAHDSIVPTKVLKHSGALTVLVIPIDFSDATGTADPESVYKKDFDTMSKWFSVYSNNKLQMNIDFKNRWFRAPQLAANYDPSAWQRNDYETQLKVSQDYINLTSNQVDFSKADVVVFVYPRNAITSTGYLHIWNASFNVGNGSQSLSVLSSLGTADKYEPFWQWMSHELLHSMGLAMHSPANPPGWGIEWGRYSYSEALLPWNQMILDWINSDQYYCVSSKNITAAKIVLVPQESELPGMRAIFVRVSNSEVLMVVSYRNGPWAHNTPDSFYGAMVALLDTSKQNDLSGESNPDAFDGVKYERPGVWLHPANKITDDMSWTNEHTGEGGALLYLGDSVTYKGITIQLVEASNFDTVEISKT